MLLEDLLTCCRCSALAAADDIYHDIPVPIKTEEMFIGLLWLAARGMRICSVGMVVANKDRGYWTTVPHVFFRSLRAMLNNRAQIIAQIGGTHAEPYIQVLDVFISSHMFSLNPPTPVLPSPVESSLLIPLT